MHRNTEAFTCESVRTATARFSKNIMLFLFLPFTKLVYDTSSRETFDKLEEWLNEVEMYSTKKDIIKMLVGNKIDKVSFQSLKLDYLRTKIIMCSEMHPCLFADFLVIAQSQKS